MHGAKFKAELDKRSISLEGQDKMLQKAARIAYVQGGKRGVRWLKSRLRESDVVMSKRMVQAIIVGYTLTTRAIYYDHPDLASKEAYESEITRAAFPMNYHRVAAGARIVSVDEALHGGVAWERFWDRLSEHEAESWDDVLGVTMEQAGRAWASFDEKLRRGGVAPPPGW